MISRFYVIIKNAPGDLHFHPEDLNIFNFSRENFYVSIQHRYTKASRSSQKTYVSMQKVSNVLNFNEQATSNILLTDLFSTLWASEFILVFICRVSKEILRVLSSYIRSFTEMPYFHLKCRKGFLFSCSHMREYIFHFKYLIFLYTKLFPCGGSPFLHYI